MIHNRLCVKNLITPFSGMFRGNKTLIETSPILLDVIEFISYLHLSPMADSLIFVFIKRMTDVA